MASRMKIILTTDLPTYNWHAGDVVEVAGGFARNFLFPNGVAKPATPENLKTNEQQVAAQMRREAEMLAEAQRMKMRLENHTVHCELTMGTHGKAHGAVTTKQIAQACFDQHGIKIEAQMIDLTAPIKAFGTYRVNVRLAPSVTAELTLSVDGRAA